MSENLTSRLFIKGGSQSLAVISRSTALAVQTVAARLFNRLSLTKGLCADPAQWACTPVFREAEASAPFPSTSDLGRFNRISAAGRPAGLHRNILHLLNNAGGRPNFTFNRPLLLSSSNFEDFTPDLTASGDRSEAAPEKFYIDPERAGLIAPPLAHSVVNY